MNIQPCRGCRACFDRGEDYCPLKDDLASIRDKVRDADGIILASPVYVEDINGIMKNWIDRQAFVSHRPEYFGKAAYLITTSGGGSSKHALSTMGRALHAWGFHVAGMSRFRMGALIKNQELGDRFKNDMQQIAERLFKAIKYQNLLKPSLYSFMAFKIQQSYWLKRKEFQNTIDYKYWNEHGWLDSHRKFYIDHRAGHIKVFFGRLLGRIAAVFFI